MTKPQIGDIWEYTYPHPEYGAATLLVLDYFMDGDYHLCLKLEDGSVGDWYMDLDNKYEAFKWRWLA